MSACTRIHQTEHPHHQFADRSPGGNLCAERKGLSILGETQDISENGLSFIVSSIRLGEHYLVSDGTVLDLEIDLPEGKLHVKAAGCRYQQIDQDCSVGRFLVGAKFVEVSAKDKILLAEYLEAEKRFGKNKVKNVQWGLDPTRP